MKAEWITHNGQKIYFVDFSKLELEEMIKLLNLSIDEVKKVNGKVKMISNYGDTTIGKKFIDAYANWAKTLKVKVDKSAVYVLNFGKRVMLKTFNSVHNLKIQPFETKEEALDYLTKNA